MQRATMANNIAHKRASLETGTLGIQKAMGKGTVDARMTAIETTHPYKVLVTLGPHSAETVRTVCRQADLECKFSLSGRVLKCMASRLQCVFDILCHLDASGIKAHLGQKPRLVDNPEDVLSALEHFMGTEGKAREMVCPQCSASELVCLS